MRRLGASARGGFSLLEIVIALAVFVIALLGLVSAISFVGRNNATQRENEAAQRAAQAVVEDMRSRPVKELFALYDTNKLTGEPGPTFTPALMPVENAVGRVSFPGTGTTLAEVVDDADPLLRDLNANTLQGEADVKASYVLLPVTITVEWKGVSGPRTYTHRHVFFDPTFAYPKTAPATP